MISDWNCMSEGKEPNWREYDAIEIDPLKAEELRDGSTTFYLVDEAEADMWTVFGHLRIDGGCECLHDCMSREEAEQLARWCEKQITAILD